MKMSRAAIIYMPKTASPKNRRILRRHCTIRKQFSISPPLSPKNKRIFRRREDQQQPIRLAPPALWRCFSGATILVIL